MAHTPVLLVLLLLVVYTKVAEAALAGDVPAESNAPKMAVVHENGLLELNYTQLKIMHDSAPEQAVELADTRVKRRNLASQYCANMWLTGKGYDLVVTLTSLGGTQGNERVRITTGAPGSTQSYQDYSYVNNVRFNAGENSGSVHVILKGIKTGGLVTAEAGCKCKDYTDTQVRTEFGGGLTCASLKSKCNVPMFAATVQKACPITCQSTCGCPSHQLKCSKLTIDSSQYTDNWSGTMSGLPESMLRTDGNWVGQWSKGMTSWMNSGNGHGVGDSSGRITGPSKGIFASGQSKTLFRRRPCNFLCVQIPM